MRNKRAHIVVAAISLLWMMVSHVSVSAGSVTVTETCNVQVTFTATVPDSIEQGKTFTVSNITVSPSRSYGFNVTSSVFQMSATNTSSSSYNQDFLSTNPSPTTGYSKYVAYYPNWIINATGPVGSSVAIKLVKTVTTIPGYGGSPVTCVFTKTLATVPIVAVAPTPTQTPEPTPTQTTTPAPTPTTTQTPNPTLPSTTPTLTTSPIPVVSPSPSSTTSTGSSSSRNGVSKKTSGSSTNASKSSAGSTANQPAIQEVAVVPLSVEVRDSLGGAAKGAVVTLDGAQKLTTDTKGRVAFSNVLTGKHVLLVSYNGQTVSRDINLDMNNIGSVVAIKLPPSAQPQNLVLPALGAAIVVSGIATTIFIRRRHAADAKFVAPATAIHGAIAGSVGITPMGSTLRPVPPIVVFEPKASTPNPAPWDLSRAVSESVTQPTVPSVGVQSTVYTQEAQPPVGSQVQVPTFHTQSPLPSKGTSQAKPTNGQLNAPI